MMRCAKKDFQLYTLSPSLFFGYELGLEPADTGNCEIAARRLFSVQGHGSWFPCKPTTEFGLVEGSSWVRHSLYFQTRAKMEGWRAGFEFGNIRIWALWMGGHMLSVQCLRTASAQEIAATRGSEGGWRFTALRFFSSLVIFLSAECKDHTCRRILKTLKKLLLLSPFTNRRQLIWLLTSNFLCFCSFLNKLWSCVLTRVTTVAKTRLRKGQTAMGREKNTSESAP